VQGDDSCCGGAAHQRRADQSLGGQSLAPGQAECFRAAAGARVCTQRAANRGGLQCGGGDRGEDEGQLAALLSDRVCVGRALAAASQVSTQMAAQERGPPAVGNLLPDLSAINLACRALAHEVGPGLKDERLDLTGLAGEHLGDLGMRQVAQLKQDESDALVLRKRRNIGHELAQLLAALDGLGHPFDRYPDTVGLLVQALGFL